MNELIPIYRIDHVAQVVENVEEQSRLLRDAFGFRQVAAWESRREGCSGRMFALPGRGGVRWELLAPLGDDSALGAFLASPVGPGIHHVAVETNDFPAALGALGRLGLLPVRRHEDRTVPWIDVALSPRGPADSVGGDRGTPQHGLLVRLFGAPVTEVCGDQRGSMTGGAPGARIDGSADDDTAGTMGIVELAHVCQASTSLDDLARWNAGLLGMRPVFRTPPGKHPDMATMMLTVPGSHVIWELIAPDGESSFIERFIAKRGEASCHHVTFQVADWVRAVSACERWGIPVFGESAGVTDGGRWRDAFIHPKHSGGVLIQLFWEERPGVWMRSDKIPAGGEKTPWISR